MLQNTVIVCFGEDLGGNPFSKYHIMKRLAQHNRIIYVEGIGARLPVLSLQDLRRIVSKLWRFINPVKTPELLENTPYPANFDVIHPLVIPWHNRLLARKINAKILWWQITRSEMWDSRSTFVLWVGNPAVPEMMLAHNPAITIYHCADKLVATSSSKHRAFFDQLHKFWALNAQLVLTPSEVLNADLSEVSPNVELLPHGVDFDHFAQAATQDIRIPDDIQLIPKPIAGYFGTISQQWFDAELVAEVARIRPNVSFVFIGPCYDGIDKLPSLQLPNIHFLGAKLYKHLPNYGAAFSVCIIPKVKSELTAASMPLKLREYLAMGKSIITTLDHGVRFERYVKYAPDVLSFAQAIDECLSEDSPQQRLQRQSVVMKDSWDKVVEHLSNRLLDKLIDRNHTMTRLG